MTDVLIKRELLERIDETAICDGTDATISDDLFTQLVAALSAPRQPEVDGLEVVESLHVWRATNRFGDTCHFGDAGCARAWAGAEGKVDRIELKPVPELYDVNHSDAAEVSATEIKVVAWAHCADATRLLCDLGKQRSVPGHYADEFTIPLCCLSDHLRAIAELRGECSFLKDCQENAMLHMTGLVAERDTLRQQLAERDAELKKVNADRLSCWAEFKVMTRSCLEAENEAHTLRQQRDKLAGLLREIAIGISKRDMPTEQQMNAWFDRIDAALAEVNK